MTPPDPTAVPRLRPQLAAAAIDDHTLVLQSEARCVVLRGEGVAAVARLIDGERSAQAIAQALAPGLSQPVVVAALEGLAHGGHLEDTHRPAPAHTVAVHGPAQQVQQAQEVLAAAGLRTGTPADLDIVLYDDPLDARWVECALSFKGPVLLCRLAGAQPTIGPLIDPGDGPCPRCLADAFAWNHPVQRFVHERLGQAYRVPPLHSPGGMAAATGLLALTVAQVLNGDRRLRSALRAFDLRSQQTSLHAVRRRPQCPHCGDPQWMRQQGHRAPVLQERPAVHREDGGHRTCSAEHTLALHRSLVSPLTGIVNYLHPMPGRHSEHRKVYVSGYQVCPQQWPADNGFDKVCAGKGRTDAQAQASALCEAIERASGVWQGDEAVQMGSRAELGIVARPFNDLQGFSTQQFARRHEINAATTDRRRQVPLPFDDHATVAWTPAWSLAGGDRHLVPLAYCFAETPPAWGSAYGMHNPNGTAAGNCFEEAVLQGLLELIERDATAIWWYQRAQRPELDLALLDDPWVSTLLADHAANGWRVQVLDLTHDLGVPVYAAVAHHGRLDRHAVGFGCHLQGRIAVNRALTELNQLLDDRPNAPPPWDRRLLPHAPFLDASGVTHHLPDLSRGNDLRQDITTCLERVTAAGLDALVVDKTRPDFGLCVAQVIVPGLCHFWPRFGSRRLYDVPEALGWKARADAEPDLNPAPLFL